MTKSMSRKTILKDAGVVLITSLLVMSSVILMADTRKSENATPFAINTDRPDTLQPQTNNGADSPCASCDRGWFFYHNGDIYNGVGLTAGGTWEAAIRLTPTELAPYCGCLLTAVKFYHWDSNYTFGNIKIYDAGTSSAPGALIYSQPYSVNNSGWIVVPLTVPIQFDCTRDLWVSVEVINQLPGQYPIGIDSGPAVVTKGDWAYYSGAWQELLIVGLNNNWLIEAYFDCGPSLTISKTDNLNQTECVKQCEYINYTICVTTYATSQHNVVITDPLPDETAFVDASPGYSISSRIVTWNIGTVAASTTKCVWLLVLVRPETANGTIIHNEAFTTSNESTPAYVGENTSVCSGCCYDVKITGGFGIHVSISNICDHTETAIPWDISVSGAVSIGAHRSGTIASLAPGASAAISSFVFGFGRITITVIVDDCPPFIATAILWGPFVLGVHQIPHLSCETCG